MVVTYSKEEVANIVGDVYCQPNVGEVKAVAESDERQTNEVVTHKLLEILARRFHAQDENNCLLSPVCGLEKVVELEDVFMGHVWESLVHARGVKVPHRCLAHDVHAPRAAKSEVDGGVHLFHETGLFALGLDTSVACQGLEQLLHDEFAGKGQDNNVEGHKSDIPWPLAILRWGTRSRALGDGQLVAEEDEVICRVRLGGVQGVEAAEDGQQKGGQCPCVLHGVVGDFLRQTARLASLGLTFRRGRVFSVGSLFWSKRGQLPVTTSSVARRAMGEARTLPLAAFKWAKEVDRAGAPVSPLSSAAIPLDFLLRRAALPLASWEVENWS